MATHPSPAASPCTVTEAEEKRYAELQLMALDFARHGETETLHSMLRAGLAANLEDHRGNTLLMLAAYNGHADTVRMLLACGADVDRRNGRGQTPLGGAAFKGDVEMLGILFDAGADVNADNGGGMTPLMFAGMFGRWPAAAFLKKRGAARGRRTLRSTAMHALALVWRTWRRLRTLPGSTFGGDPAAGPAARRVI
ncbi:ankyrin [Opitutaceae bacterium TAV5]|nr:ankyrin [Opitutaceae bacterium TAV5]